MRKMFIENLPRRQGRGGKEIDWNKVNKLSTNNLIKEVGAYYQSNSNLLQKEVANHFNICLNTFRRYLEKGKKLGWYVDKKEYR